MIWKSGFLPVVLLLAASLGSEAQPPKVTKVDPPNWWEQMPPAMLLLKGENLGGAEFHIDGSLHVDRTSVSANGHWAEVWLADNPGHPEKVMLTVQSEKGKAVVPFSFEARQTMISGFAGFSSSDVMYLIMTDRFADGDHANDGPDARSQEGSPSAIAEREKPKGWHGGDLRGIQQHLDYLQQLGITTVWITPVYQNHGPEAYHGYHATDMYSVDEHYGSLEDLKSLSAALHQRKMKLVLDTVPNHVGPFHPWVEDEPDPLWFHGTRQQHRSAQFEFQPLTNGHAPWRDRRDVTEGWFVDLLPDMNQENPAAAKYLTQNAIWWIEEARLDGLRIDTFPYVGRPFWHDFHAALHALYPKLTTVGEVSNGDPLITSSFAGGVTRDGMDTGLSTPFDFPLHFAIRNVFAGDAPMTQLSDILRQDSLYPHPERLSPFLDNHDFARFMSEPGATSAKEKSALAFLLTTRGMPQLYAGDEIALEGGNDPDNRRDFPGGFAKTAQDVFMAEKRTPTQREVLDWTSSLMALRSKSEALQGGQEQILYSSNDAIVYVRFTAGEHQLIAIHKGPEEVVLQVQTADTEIAGLARSIKLLGDGSITLQPSEMSIRLPADGVLIAALEK